MTKVDLASIAKMADKGSVELGEPTTVKPSSYKEHKTQRRMVNLKPSKYEAFISTLGRQPFSDAVRNLILDNLKNRGK